MDCELLCQRRLNFDLLFLFTSVLCIWAYLPHFVYKLALHITRNWLCFCRRLNCDAVVFPSNNDLLGAFAKQLHKETFSVILSVTSSVSPDHSNSDGFM
jgi:hypothetical protein